ncbi:Bardet-Biedl syndrome 1 protein isoform X2 [Halyomorpha halys]|uniref:Bardet-Biedl syndrome 1 protein isoform X2 n=1 Tax=Halyomorpha halys TaxID=286706 RepID=UPI0006D4F947
MAFGRPKQQTPWIEAFTDTSADLQTLCSCLALGDLNADNDCKLIIGDFGNGIQLKLKVYKGTTMVADLPLLSQPAGILCIYTDRNEPRIPGIGVATGSNLLVYRNCRPYFKFTLTPEHCLSLESDIWGQYQDADMLIQQLKGLSLSVGFSNLSTISQNLLLMEPSSREMFLKTSNHFSIKKQMVITCVCALSKYTSNNRDVSCILMASENSHLFVMDPETFTLLNDFTVPDICSCLAATGIYFVEFTILMVCRNGSLYYLSGGNIHFIAQLCSLPVSLISVHPKIITANMDNTLSCFNLQGQKYWTISLPADPLSMTGIPIAGLALDLVAVSLSDGSIHFYNGANLVHTITTTDPVSSMIFGRYGQEEHALISISSSGMLDIRLLKRTAQFNKQSKLSFQLEYRPSDIKLLVPKKNKLFLGQTVREIQNCKDMHVWFHHSWLGLKVLASEAFITAIHNFSVLPKESLKMMIKVVGLGPRMKIMITLENLSQNVIPQGLKITFIFDPKIYNINTSVIKLLEL